MAIEKRNRALFPNLPAFFNDLYTPAFLDWGQGNFSDSGTTLPAVNVKETPDNFEVAMAAPGMTKKDFHIELDGHRLTISSEKTDDREESTEGANYSRREFSYQAFQRSFDLPKDVVDEDKINASYENGVLKLVIPKQEKAKQKPPRTIEIA